MTNSNNSPNKFKIYINEQGDVPGWVLITLMTAGLVVVLWSVATPALSGILNQSLNKVANF